jgi:hypothetical protein
MIIVQYTLLFMAYLKATFASVQILCSLYHYYVLGFSGLKGCLILPPLLTPKSRLRGDASVMVANLVLVM